VQDPAATAFKANFNTPEQILLAGLLNDGAQAKSFAQDARLPVTPDLLDRWRANMVLFAKDYISKAHPLNENARTVQQMVEPSEWATLKTSLKFLESGSWADQAKVKAMVMMIDHAKREARPGRHRRGARRRQPGATATRDGLREVHRLPRGPAGAGHDGQAQAGGSPEDPGDRRQGHRR